MNLNEVKTKIDNLDNESFILTEEIFKYKLYLVDDENGKKYKPKTISDTFVYVLYFNRFLKAAYPELINIQMISELHINTYKSFCLDILRNEHKTVNKKLHSIRMFFAYLKDIRWLITINPALNINYLHVDKEDLPTPIPISSLKIIFDTLLTFRYAARDVLITKLIVNLGIQVSSVFEIKLSDIDMANRTLTIKKLYKIDNTFRDFTYSLNNNVFNLLDDYLKQRTILDKNDSEYLFLSHNGDCYSLRSYQAKFKEAVLIADFPIHYTPRNLRATFCFHMAKEVEMDRLKTILNQEKVDHFYIGETANHNIF